MSNTGPSACPLRPRATSTNRQRFGSRSSDRNFCGAEDQPQPGSQPSPSHIGHSTFPSANNGIALNVGQSTVSSPVADCLRTAHARSHAVRGQHRRPDRTRRNRENQDLISLIIDLDDFAGHADPGASAKPLDRPGLVAVLAELLRRRERKGPATHSLVCAAASATLLHTLLQRTAASSNWAREQRPM